MEKIKVGHSNVARYQYDACGGQNWARKFVGKKIYDR